MDVSDKTNPSEDFKPFLHDNCMKMINELQDKQIQLMEIYKSNPTFPFDFYNISIREADTRIQAVRDLYKQMTNEELL
jgi:hypothetical protein